MKVLGLILVLAVAYQATALPAPAPAPLFGILDGITNPITNFLGNVTNALTAATQTALASTANTIGNTLNATVTVANQLSVIPKSAVDLALETLNAQNQAAQTIITQVNTRLQNILSQVPSLSSVIQNAQNTLAKLPTQLQATIGAPLADFIESVQNSAAAGSQDAIDAMNDIINDINTTFENIANSVNPQANIQAISDKIQQLLASAAQQTTSAGEAALTTMATNAQNLINAMQTSLENIANAAETAAAGVLDQLKSAISNVRKQLQDAFNAAVDKIKEIATNASNALASAATAANNAINAGLATVTNAASSGLNVMALRARELKDKLATMAANAATLVQNTQQAIADSTNQFVAALQMQAAQFEQNLENVFSDLNTQIKDALASGSADVQACANAAITSLQGKSAALQTSATQCYAAASASFDAAVNVTLNQAKNALTAQSQLATAASNCVTAAQQSTSLTKYLDGAACLTGVSAQITAQSITSAFSTLVADLSNKVQTGLTSAQTCGSSMITAAQAVRNNLQQEFQTCFAAVQG